MITLIHIENNEPSGWYIAENITDLYYQLTWFDNIIDEEDTKLITAIKSFTSSELKFTDKFELITGWWLIK